MRLIVVAIYLILYTIISIPLFLILFVVGKINDRKRAVISQKIVVHLGFRPILFISGVKLTVKGKENVLKDQSALYVFNHRGFLIFWQDIPQRLIRQHLYQRWRLKKFPWFHYG